MFSAELVMTLPLFGIILAGLFEFALLFQGRTELAEATRAGARIATLPGVRADQVEQEGRGFALGGPSNSNPESRR